MFHSTNFNSNEVNFKTAILRGQALDRGLYMLNQIPRLDAQVIFNFKKFDLPQLAKNVLSLIVGESIPKKRFESIIEDALNFKVPVEKINQNNYICYLDRGPTCSFKDFGARTLARIMEYFLNEENKEAIILTATSGDTGGAVAQAFHNRSNLKVVILYPENEISELQRKQMTTLGGNVVSIGIQGKFDDCQKYIKKAFADEDLNHLNLSSANSINFGRLLPQTIYYFWSYSRIVEFKGEEVIYSVPSGNFGNLMGGLIAHKMGLPVKKFIAAVNENDEFPNFLNTGKYEKVEPSRNCISNAMNVGNPSNLARLIDLFGGHMDEEGRIIKKPDMDNIRELIASYSISDEETKKTIKNFYENYQKIIEPHGAVGWKGLQNYFGDKVRQNNVKSITFETADPAKFPTEIINLISIKPKLPSTLEKIKKSKEIRNSLIITSYDDFKTFLLNNY
ncbi:MAG: threonine synthase [Candidatus Lokiarchaeota archaeon]|nr:threonine synthase [Candidatus Lokiarchaeota archaeon]MBD3202485.1 threonine synthase [Candidatus Lokiarchaeota archaeon]